MKRELNAQTHMRIKMPVACFAFDVLLHFGEACRYLPALNAPTNNTSLQLPHVRLFSIYNQYMMLLMPCIGI